MHILTHHLIRELKSVLAIIKMNREIILGDRTIKYDLEYKKVKNINLRIKSDCSVCVSANKRVPQKVIDEFIISKVDFILRALEKYKNMPVKEQIQYYTQIHILTKCPMIEMNILTTAIGSISFINAVGRHTTKIVCIL